MSKLRHVHRLMWKTEATVHKYWLVNKKVLVEHSKCEEQQIPKGAIGIQHNKVVK